jgi:periplasmic protein TonB
MTAHKMTVKGFAFFVIAMSPIWLSAQVAQVDSITKLPSEIPQEVIKNPEPVFTYVEEMPSFPKGETALLAYLAKYVNYPAEAKTKKLQGVVYLSFIVETDGSLTNIEVKRGDHPVLNAEAVQVVSNMPNWVPAKHNGKTVRCNMSLPVRFKL